MGSRLLTGLPRSPESIAFRAIVGILQTDPFLKRAAINWSVWDNSPTDEAAPTLAQLPYVQLTPAPQRTGWAEESQHWSNFDILVGIAVKGTHADDVIDLWGAIRTALFPQEVARRDHVRSVLGPLVVNGSLTGQPFAVSAPDDSAKILTAGGKLSVVVLVNT